MTVNSSLPLQLEEIIFLISKQESLLSIFFSERTTWFNIKVESTQHQREAHRHEVFLAIAAFGTAIGATIFNIQWTRCTRFAKWFRVPVV